MSNRTLPSTKGSFNAPLDRRDSLIKGVGYLEAELQNTFFYTDAACTMRSEAATGFANDCAWGLLLYPTYFWGEALTPTGRDYGSSRPQKPKGADYSPPASLGKTRFSVCATESGILQAWK